MVIASVGGIDTFYLTEDALKKAHPELFDEESERKCAEDKEEKQMNAERIEWREKSKMDKGKIKARLVTLTDAFREMTREEMRERNKIFVENNEPYMLIEVSE